MYGVLLLLNPLMDFVTMSCLWIIILISLGYTYLKTNLMCFLLLLNLRLSLGPNSPLKFKPLMGVVNTHLVLLRIFSPYIVLFIKFPAHIHLNKMALSKENIDILWKLLLPFFLTPSFHILSSLMQFLLLHTLLTLLPTSTLHSQSLWSSLYGHTPDLSQL